MIRPELYYKLKDMQVLYKGFFDYLGREFYYPGRGSGRTWPCGGKIPEVKGQCSSSGRLYRFYTYTATAFGKASAISSQVYVTVTMGTGEDPYQPGSPHQLFYLSKQTVGRLCRLAQEHGIYWDEQWLPLRGEPYQGRFAEEPPP